MDTTIEIGTKFKVHRKGEEEYHAGKEYEVAKLTRGCTCNRHSQPHLHIVADVGTGKRWFNGYDENTLRSIEDPDNDYLEIVSLSGCQLTMF